jgi:hypothetical protein
MSPAVLSVPPQRLVTGLVMLFVCGFLLADAPRWPAAGLGMITVVYVGAEDCGPCRAWRRDERPQFLSSREFSALHYREVIAERLRDLLDESLWPADLASLHERVRERPGAPQWFMLRDGRIVGSEAGISSWRRSIWPAIRATVAYPVASGASPFAH